MKKVYQNVNSALGDPVCFETFAEFKVILNDLIETNNEDREEPKSMPEFSAYYDDPNLGELGEVIYGIDENEAREEYLVIIKK